MTTNVNIEIYNKYMYDIISNSQEVSDVMLDLLYQMPEMFKMTNFDKVKGTVVDFICNPKLLKETDTSTTFVNILNSNIAEGHKVFKVKKKRDTMACSLRSKVIKFIKDNNPCEKVEKLVGCSRGFLINHLESQFTDGMTWENYGRLSWHIDHIEPLCSFDLTDLQQVKKAIHYSNLQPLFAEDNRKKSIEDKKKSIRRK